MKISLKVKAVLVVLVFTVILSVSTVLVSYFTYSKSFEDHYEKLAASISKSTATVVDKSQVKKVASEVKKVYYKFCEENGGVPDYDSFSDKDWEKYYARFEYITKMPEYRELLDVLQKLRKDNGVVSLYLGYNDIETMKDLYLVDASAEGQGCLPGDCDDTEPEQIERIKAGIYEQPAYITNYEEYGWLCSASAPIKDEDGTVIGVALVDISMNKIMQSARNFLFRLILIIAFTALLMIVLVSFLTDRAMLAPISRLSTAAGLYVAGKKDDINPSESAIAKLNIKTGDEIENLFNSIKQMEKDINTYITDLTAVTAEKERIGAELDVAKNIQASMLPCIFPAFPERSEFDIYATMTPAKEVGGDFYDFFLIDSNHLAVVMADVSGKGVPAALFMVIAKTLIKNSALNGLSPKQTFEKVNNQLCENNDAGMFVTAWLGILEISTGKMVCANAGHEYPAIKRKNGDFELYSDKHGFVLAGMENVKYREYEIELSEGDKLFVYTDGVPEATNAENELFDTKRMLDALNRNSNADCETILANVRAGIDEFVGDAPQFDDITMLAIEINPKNQISLKPTAESIGQVLEFVEKTMINAGADKKTIGRINIAADEIYTNIVSYSGAQNAEISCEAGKGRVTVTFADDGKEYNPLKAPDPDTTLSAEERRIGGLGIFMVKKSMDDMRYEYKDGKNILTIVKNIQEGQE